MKRVLLLLKVTNISCKENTHEPSFLDSEIFVLSHFSRLHIMLVDTQLARKLYKVRFLDAKCLILDRYTREVMKLLKASPQSIKVNKIFFSFFLVA